MQSNNSSLSAAIAAHIQRAKAENDSHQDGAYAAFTKEGFAYARFPLRASPKQIREANHLMLQQGYCYLRLFAVKYGRQIAACLGYDPTFTRVEQQLGKHHSFRRGDSFVTVYISGPLQADIAKSRKENPFHLGTLRRLNDGMPIRVSADRAPRPALPARTPPTATSTEVAMIDFSMLPEAGEEQVVMTEAVPANQMTIAQLPMTQAVWQRIQLARQDARISKEELYNLEVRFNSLVTELNNAYRRITQYTEGGMRFL